MHDFLRSMRQMLIKKTAFILSLTEYAFQKLKNSAIILTAKNRNHECSRRTIPVTTSHHLFSLPFFSAFLSFLTFFAMAFLNWYARHAACIVVTALVCSCSSLCLLAFSSSWSLRSSMIALYCFSRISKSAWSFASSALSVSYMRV